MRKKEKFHRSCSHKSISALSMSRRVSAVAGAGARTIAACFEAIKATGGVRNLFGKCVAVEPKPLEVRVRFAPFSDLGGALTGRIRNSDAGVDDVDPNASMKDSVGASIPQTPRYPEDMAAAGLSDGKALPVEANGPTSGHALGVFLMCASGCTSTLFEFAFDGARLMARGAKRVQEVGLRSDGATSKGGMRDAKRRRGQGAGPLPSGGKSAAPLGSPKIGKCGYCDAVESDANAFPDAKFPGGTIAKFFHACSYHIKACVRGQWRFDFSWAAPRAETARDQEISAAFETTCEVASGRASAAPSPHDVALKTDAGCAAFSDCMIVNDQKYNKDFFPQGASTLPPTDAGERITSIKNERRAEEVSGILVLDPDRPHTKVRKWSSTYGSHSEWSLHAGNNCRGGQGASASGAMEKLMGQMLPSALRGRAGVPTVGEVRQRAIGAAQLELPIPLAALLDKGQDHKLGDKIYTLRRFRPRSAGTVGNARGELLDAIDAFLIIGGSAVDTMKRDARTNLLKKPKNARTTDAYKSKLKLVGGSRARGDIGVSDGQHYHPMEWGICGSDEKLRTCRDFILNRVALQLAGAIAEHVGTKEVRDGVPEDMKPLAHALYVFAESMKALLGPSPGALMRRPAGRDVRRFLREEWDCEGWGNVVFAFGETLMERVAERNRACHTDVNHGETISTYEALRSDAAAAAPADSGVIFDGFGQWGGQPRGGGATDPANKIGSSLEQWIQARVATGPDAPQFAEDPAKLATMEIKFTAFMAKAVDSRGVGETCVEKPNDVAAKLRNLAARLASAAEERGLLRACAALDFEMPETAEKVRDARQKCIGAKFARAESAKKIMECIEKCRAQGVSSLVTVAPEQVVNRPVDDIVKASGLGISLVEHVEPSLMQRGALLGDRVRPSGLVQFGKTLKAFKDYEAAVEYFDFGRVDQGGDCIHLGSRVRFFEQCKEHFDALLNACPEKLAAFSEAFWAMSMKAVNEELAELGSIAGGDLQGNKKHRAKDVADAGALGILLARAAKTLFKQKGISAKIKQLAGSIKVSSVRDAVRDADDFGEADVNAAILQAVPDRLSEVLTRQWMIWSSTDHTMVKPKDIDVDADDKAKQGIDVLSVEAIVGFTVQDERLPDLDGRLFVRQSGEFYDRPLYANEAGLPEESTLYLYWFKQGGSSREGHDFSNDTNIRDTDDPNEFFQPGCWVVSSKMGAGPTSFYGDREDADFIIAYIGEKCATPYDIAPGARWWMKDESLGIWTLRTLGLRRHILENNDEMMDFFESSDEEGRMQ
ncbi:unnamed protein product [Prorocentrum cordatum]|uniref:Uncharacterized protein n=1 Tax=Prorocentrum cordatum TaxID=2364126 RepID=A0ABN9XJ48_9DINO|nr:unnamed protein product [Polarella glacialis]